MSLNLSSALKSPHLDEIGDAVLTDPDGNLIPLEVHVHPDSNGNNELHTLLSSLTAFQRSQVTGRPNRPTINVGGVQVPIRAIMNIGAGPSLGKAGGKFQSTVQTGTGAVQNIAHGLGVAPSVVLAAVQDNTGVATVVIVEGVHTSTNLLLTVTTGAKYKVIAIA